MKENGHYNIGVYLFESANEFAGLGEYERNLGRNLADMAAALKTKYGVNLYFIVPPYMAGAYGNDVEYISVSKLEMKLLNCHLLPLTAVFPFRKFDLLHLTHQNTRLRRRLSSETLVTIHDVNFFHNHLNGGISRKQHRFERGISKATRISFISHFTSDDVRKHFKISVPSKVILNGVNNLNVGKIGCSMDLPDRFFFHISRLAAKKNVHLLIEMMKYLPGENLVIAGSGHKEYNERLKEIIRRDNLTNVFLLGNVSENEKAELYSRCSAFMFPSLSEGFGLPVVEAMCFSKPVFISDLTSLPEVGGDVAYYFKELNAGKMAETVLQKMAAFASDREHSEQLLRQHAAEFNWKAAAAEYASYYLEILGIKR